jgi:hypothetical protein
MRVYKVALKRLVNANQQILGDRTSLWFGYGDEDVKLLIEYENSLEVKLLLLDFYLLVKITKLKLMEYVKKVNAFFVKQSRADEGGDTINEEGQDEVRIPMLVIEDMPHETIVIKDEEPPCYHRSKR